MVGASLWMSPCLRFQQLKDSTTKLEALEEKGAPVGEINQLRQYVKQDQATCYKIEKGRENYQQTLRGISEVIHPFDSEDNLSQNSAFRYKVPRTFSQGF